MALNDNKYYPYKKVYGGFYDGSWQDDILKKLVDYLMDMPDANGYEPKDDNTYPRTAMWKYLYYDGANPTENPLPTPKQKKQVLFNPDSTENPPTKKRYRLFPQEWIKQSQEDSQTRIYVYIGRIIAESDFKVQMSICFQIWTHYTQEANTKEYDAYSRCLKIANCIMGALHGVNIDGVGAFYFNRTKNSDCTNSVMDDKQSNVGRYLVMGLEYGSDASTNSCDDEGDGFCW